MSSINFDNPWLLLLAIPLAALFIVPFFIAIRKDNANGHNIASGVIHIIMALLIAFVAAGTSVVTTVTQTDVYVLADVSYSANKNLDVVDGYIRDLGKSLPDNSRMGVICFGRDTQLITRLGERVKSVKTAEVDDSGTDIVGALDYAGSLFRDNVIKRIVLITDGKQTDQSDANALKTQVTALADRKIHVDAIYLDDNLKDDAREVQLSSVQYTQTACLNRQESAVITVNCSCPATGTKDGEVKPYEVEALFTLYRNGEVYRQKTEWLTRGSNAVSFDLPTGEAGTFDYEVKMECKEDENKVNNVISFTQKVSDEFKVLLITENIEDEIQLRKIYGEKAQIDAPYYLSGQVPCSVEQLCEYDEIVLSDVNVLELNNSEMFLASLDTVVSLFGKSLVTFGDMHIQNYPKGDLKALSNMLPVVFGKSEDDPKLFTLLIDTSYSLDQDNRFVRAKRAAKEIINLLSDEDYVAIVEFNGYANTVYQPVELSQSRKDLLETIDMLGTSQGTNIGLGIDAAYNLIKGGRYSQKKIMLISDGLSESLNVTDKVAEMTAEGISTSSLDVGRYKNSEASAAKTLLQNIANFGKGKYMDISTESDLESVIANDLPQESNDSRGNQSRVRIKRRSDSVLDGIENDELASKKNYVNDYLFAVEKGSAVTVLTVNYNRLSKPSQEPYQAPLYSYRAYGNGRVSTFTSAMSGNWVSGIETSIREKLFTNIMQTNIPAEKTNYPFILDVAEEDGYSQITLTPETMRLDAVTGIEVTKPDGAVVSGVFTVLTSNFGYTLETPDTGKYVIKVKYSYGGYEYEAERTLNISYSSEYDSFALYDAAVLHKAIGANGKVSENGKLTIVNDDKEVGLYNLSLNLPLLSACVALYAVDIAVRKLKWEDIRSFFKRGKKVKK